MKKTFLGIFLFIIVLLLFYGGWQVKRWFNYEFGYSNDVKSHICEMVKPEYLKNPEDCK